MAKLDVHFTKSDIVNLMRTGMERNEKAKHTLIESIVWRFRILWYQLFGKAVTIHPVFTKPDGSIFSGGKWVRPEDQEDDA